MKTYEIIYKNENNKLYKDKHMNEKIICEGCGKDDFGYIENFKYIGGRDKPVSNKLICPNCYEISSFKSLDFTENLIPLSNVAVEKQISNVESMHASSSVSFTGNEKENGNILLTPEIKEHWLNQQIRKLSVEDFERLFKFKMKEINKSIKKSNDDLVEKLSLKLSKNVSDYFGDALHKNFLTLTKEEFNQVNCEKTAKTEDKFLTKDELETLRKMLLHNTYQCTEHIKEKEEFFKDRMDEKEVVKKVEDWKRYYKNLDKKAHDLFEKMQGWVK